MGQQSFFHSGDEHRFELQPFGLVQGDEVEAVFLRLEPVLAGLEGGALQQFPDSFRRGPTVEGPGDFGEVGGRFRVFRPGGCGGCGHRLAGGTPVDGLDQSG